jgi:hypothetical protein
VFEGGKREINKPTTKPKREGESEKKSKESQPTPAQAQGGCELERRPRYPSLVFTSVWLSRRHPPSFLDGTILRPFRDLHGLFDYVDSDFGHAPTDMVVALWRSGGTNCRKAVGDRMSRRMVSYRRRCIKRRRSPRNVPVGRRMHRRR